MNRVGFIGIGHMGRGMAANLSKRASKLHIFDVLPPNQEPFSNSALFHICPTLSELATQCDIVSLSLPSEDICHDVIFGAKGLLNTWIPTKTDKRRVILDHGSFSRTFAVSTAQALSKVGVGYVDAPVSGGPAGAREGSLTIMVGGARCDYDTTLPLLQAMGKNIFYFGDVGAGMSAKLINQMLVSVHSQAACEALRLAEMYNISSTSQLQSMLSVSWGNSRMVQHVFEDYESAVQNTSNIQLPTGAPLRNLKKDLSCLTRDIPSLENLPLVRETKSAIDETCASGLQDAPFASLLQRLRKNEVK